eukprot:m.193057 g.193057  ORF g.193057 m.193057 type:complete len:906 (+) comp15439_c0_seq3:108-2825(+)
MEVAVHLQRCVCPTLRDVRLRCEFRSDGDFCELFASGILEAPSPGKRPTNPHLAANFTLPTDAPAKARLCVTLFTVDPINGAETERCSGFEDIPLDRLLRHEPTVVRCMLLGRVAPQGPALALARVDFEVTSEEPSILIHDGAPLPRIAGPDRSPVPPITSPSLLIDSTSPLSPPAPAAPSPTPLPPTPTPIPTAAALLPPGPRDSVLRVVVHAAVLPIPAEMVTVTLDCDPASSVTATCESPSTTPVWQQNLSLPYSTAAPATTMLLFTFSEMSKHAQHSFPHSLFSPTPRSTPVHRMELPLFGLTPHREHSLELLAGPARFYVTLTAKPPLPPDTPALELTLPRLAPLPQGHKGLLAVVRPVSSIRPLATQAGDVPARMLFSLTLPVTAATLAHLLPRRDESTGQTLALMPPATHFSPSALFLDEPNTLFSPHAAIVVEFYPCAPSATANRAAHAWLPPRSAMLGSALIATPPARLAQLVARKQLDLPPVAVSGPGLAANLTVTLTWHGPVPPGTRVDVPPALAPPVHDQLRDESELPSEAAQLAARGVSMLGADVALLDSPTPPARPADDEGVEMDRLRMLAKAHAEALLKIRQENAMLREQAARRQRMAAQQAAEGLGAAAAAAVAGLGQEQAMHVYRDAAACHAALAARHQDLRARVQALQNMLIGKRQNHQQLVAAERGHAAACARLQGLQDRAGVAAKLRHACAQQDQVIGRLEELLCSRPGCPIDRTTLMTSPSCRALAAEAARLQQQWLAELHAGPRHDPLASYLRSDDMMRDQRAMRDARARLAALTQRAGQLARQQQDKTLATSDPAARIALLARHEQALQRIATLKDQRAAQDRVCLMSLKAGVGERCHVHVHRLTGGRHRPAARPISKRVLAPCCWLAEVEWGWVEGSGLRS